MEINIKPLPYYQMKVILDDNNYNLTIRWIENTEKWYMDVDGISNSVSMKNIALLPGKDLFGIYGYSDLLGELWIIDNSEANEPPDYDNVGGRFTLEYTPKA
jgi:hypothetical protein